MYWHINSIKNISKIGNMIEREVTVGFRNSKGRQTVVLNPKKSVETRLLEGPIIGTRVTTLSPSTNNQTKIDVAWDIELSGIPILGRGFVKNQLVNATKEALDRIAKSVK